MSTWDQLQNLGQDFLVKIQKIYYQRSFPWEIRAALAPWIEQQSWLEVDEDSDAGTEQASSLLQSMILQIEARFKQQQDLMNQMRFFEIQKQFMDSFKDQPLKFVQIMKEIISEELQLLCPKAMVCTSAESHGVVRNLLIQTQPSPSKEGIYNDLQLMQNSTFNLEILIRDCKQHQEDFIIQYQEIGRIETEISKSEAAVRQRDITVQRLNQQKNDTETALRNQAQAMLDEREAIIQNLQSLQVRSDSTCRRICDEVLGWREAQQKSLSGGPNPGSLTELQVWFESMCDILWQLYSLATHYKILFETLPITKHGREGEEIDQLIKDVVKNLLGFVKSSFIVDKQPPQVLKTQTKFQASVRLLVGTKLNLQMGSPEVTVSILSEKQCKEFVAGQTLESVGTCGEMLNERSVMEHNKDKGILQADFKNLQLKKIKRQDRKNQESVLEAKSALVFSSVLSIGGDRLPICCISVPVVVVVHGNQGPNSEATIIWDNMFSDPRRQPFEVPAGVTLQRMLCALNMRWNMSCGTHLHEEHLVFMKEKLFSTVADQVPNDQNVPWELFNKEPVKGRPFTFWEWFHGAMEVIKKNLRSYWMNGSLEFISRQRTQERLLQMPSGTFLIRFSDGIIGAVTIAWCGEVEKNGKLEKEIFYLQPWTSKDFTIRSLADRIFDIPQLTRLFPDIPKEEAFGDLASGEAQQDVEQGGYVRSGIVARIIKQSSGETPIPSPMSNNDLTLDSVMSPTPSHFDEAISPLASTALSLQSIRQFIEANLRESGPDHTRLLAGETDGMASTFGDWSRDSPVDRNLPNWFGNV